ncbi:MAG: hypothetical protein GY862_17220 [Gammaproteobacteria bacterium]|nr:hypothetical protein [Gammaproteobacteria bacterium]
MNFLEIQADHQTIPASRGELPERVHLFDKPSINAVNAAPAAKRGRCWCAASRASAKAS